MQARAHPNVLRTIAWLNTLYHLPDSSASDSDLLDGVQLEEPLVYADRLRIRRPGVQWDVHPPHIDGMRGSTSGRVVIANCEEGGAIERWEDPHFRSCYQAILSGDWKKHDPYDLTARLNAKLSLYGRPNQVRYY